MHEFEALGQQVRAFLTGLLDAAPRSSSGEQPTAWGPHIDLNGLDDLYAGTSVDRYTVPAGGIDNLALSSTDVFEIPGRGQFEVDFEGYFRVARAQPASQDWAEASVFVNLADMRLRGTHPDLGDMSVTLNPDVVSAGQTFGPGESRAPAACRIAAAAQFRLDDQDVTVFNKEPVLLMNDAIESIPPVEDPNGAARIYRLPLYSRADPDGRPVAYLRSLRYTVGDYITPERAAECRKLVRD